MSSYELLTRLPVFPIGIMLLAAIVYGTFKIYMRNRDQKGLGGQILLYSLLAILFAIDFFLFLKRDGFHATWSLTFWLVLAAFMVGERVGRLTSPFSADEVEREPVDERLSR
jgi:hypothetical protein